MAYPVRRTYLQMQLDLDVEAYGSGQANDRFIPQIKKVLNEAAQDVWIELLVANADLFRVVTPLYINITEGNNAYDLPANFHRAKIVEYLTPNATQYKILKHIDETGPEFRPLAVNSTQYVDDFKYYDLASVLDTSTGAAFMKQQIILSGTPKTAVTQGLRIIYWYKPDPMVADGDYLNMDVEAESVVFNRAAAMFIGRFLHHDSRASIYKAFSDEQIRKILSLTKNREIAQSETLRTGRR